MRESVIENKICSWATKNGWLVRKLSYIGRNSAPDRLFIKRAVVIFMEIKATDGVVRPGQAREIKRLQEHDARAFVVNSAERGIDLLKAFS